MVALLTIAGILYLLACLMCITGVLALARTGCRTAKSGFHIGRSGFFVEAADGTTPGHPPTPPNAPPAPARLPPPNFAKAQPKGRNRTNPKGH